MQGDAGKCWLAVENDDELVLQICEAVDLNFEREPPATIEHDGATYQKTNAGKADAVLKKKTKKRPPGPKSNSGITKVPTIKPSKSSNGPMAILKPRCANKSPRPPLTFGRCPMIKYRHWIPLLFAFASLVGMGVDVRAGPNR